MVVRLGRGRPGTGASATSSAATMVSESLVDFPRPANSRPSCRVSRARASSGVNFVWAASGREGGRDRVRGSACGGGGLDAEPQLVRDAEGVELREVRHQLGGVEPCPAAMAGHRGVRPAPGRAEHPEQHVEPAGRPIDEQGVAVADDAVRPATVDDDRGVHQAGTPARGPPSGPAPAPRSPSSSEVCLVVSQSSFTPYSRPPSPG